MKEHVLTTFSELGLHKHVLKAIANAGYETPTPIQAQAIPLLLKDNDLLGIAQTGTGKTAAFALPTLDYLAREPKDRVSKRPRVLVLSPTRELASQIAESFKTYSSFMTSCIVQTVFGGVKIGRQIINLNKGCDVLVATPGRLLDLMEQKAVFLSDIEVVILDEADQMFDLGFFPTLKKIMATVPRERQTMLFSATMPKQIAEMAKAYLDAPEKVSVAPESTTAERVSQGVLHAATSNKPALLSAVLKDPSIDRVLVFTRTKHGADKLVRKLLGEGREAAAIHGNKSQGQRTKALQAFKSGKCKILIATDIAARGIDIDGVTHVINYDLPNVAEQYVHRIGRTARAGREGVAISLVCGDDLAYLRDIEKITKQEISVLEAPEGSEALIASTPDRSVKPKRPVRQNRGGAGRPSPRKGQSQKARPARAGGAGAGRPKAKTEGAETSGTNAGQAKPKSRRSWSTNSASTKPGSPKSGSGRPGSGKAGEARSGGVNANRPASQKRRRRKPAPV